MKKAVAIMSLTLSASAMAEVYVGSAYIDHHPANASGGLDVVSQLDVGSNVLVIDYSDPALGRREVTITGGPSKPMSLLTNLQFIGGDVYANVVFQNGKTGYVVLPKNGSSNVSFIQGDPQRRWEVVGVAECDGGPQKCPVLLYKNKQLVPHYKDHWFDGSGQFLSSTPSPWFGDLGTNGAWVTYDDSANQYNINMIGLGGRKSCMPVVEGGGPVEQTVGSHCLGFDVRAVDPETKVDLLVINSEKNQIGFIVEPYEGIEYFFPFYLRNTGGGELALAGIGTGGCSWNCNAEPEDSVNVDEYSFSTPVGWFFDDNDLWELYLRWVDFVLSRTIPAPPAGCKINVGYDGQPNFRYTQGYTEHYYSWGIANLVRFKAVFRWNTDREQTEWASPNKFERHWLHDDLWAPKRTWEPLPFGTTKFWSSGPHGDLYDGCIHIPLPTPLNIDQTQ